MADQPLLDDHAVAELQDLLGEDAAGVYAEYLADSRRLIDEMEQAAVQCDTAALTPLAHTLKGSSGNLGVALIYELAKGLEAQGRAGAISDPKGEVDRIKQAFLSAQDVLKALAGQP